MMKLIGSVLLVTATTGLGMWKANSYSERNKELQQFITALQMLETEIVYGATPLPEAFSRIGLRIPGRIGSLLDETGRSLGKGDGHSAGQIFQEKLAKWEEKIHLLRQDREILQTFGQTLGNSDRTDQIKHIRLANSRLVSEQAIARDEKDRLGKMWRYLGALIGLAGVIIMY